MSCSCLPLHLSTPRQTHKPKKSMLPLLLPVINGLPATFRI